MKRALAILSWMLSWAYPLWLVHGPSKELRQGFSVPVIGGLATIVWITIARRGSKLALPRRQTPFFLKYLGYALVVCIIISCPFWALEKQLLARVVMAPPYILWWLANSLWDVPDVWRWASPAPPATRGSDTADLPYLFP